MSDVTQAATPSTIIRVPITKGKDFIELDTSTIPDDVYREMLLQGAKVLLNRGQSKITKASTKDEAEMKKLAMEAANKQLELVMTSKIKFTGGKAKKASGAVMTEARRIARARVKDALKEAGIKISHVEVKEITAAANALIEADASLIAQATTNLEERAKTPIAIDVTALVKTSPKLVKAAEERKAKDQLSKTQAGKVAKRAKPGAQPTA